MKVSILIPTFNRLPLLRESLESARAQTHPEVEIVVSDDGSSDGTAEYVESVAAGDPRVRLTPRNPERGLFTNINHLVREARGEAFCIVADDDRIHPEFVASLVRPLEEDADVVAAFCDHWIVTADGERSIEGTDHNSEVYGRTLLGPGPLADPLSTVLRGSMCMGFSLYRSSVFQAEPFDLACGGAADFDYAIRAARIGKLYYVPGRLGDYRAHAQTATNTRPYFMIDGAIHAFRKYEFEEEAHESIRRRWLQRSYRSRAFLASTEDRRAWLQSVSRYAGVGGRLLDREILLSLLLVLPPKPLGSRLRHALRAARNRIRALSA